MTDVQALKPKLWSAADKLRGNVDASEYKRVVLGLIFLKYISDSFQALFDVLAATQASEYTDPEDPDEYRSENVFWVPPEARWQVLQNNARQPEIGTLIDNAMRAIEDSNPSLKGVLPQDYGRDDLDKRRLGELVDLIGTISLGTEANRSRDLLGQVYEYFLGQFAMAEGKKGGEFHTPQPIVRLIVEILAPYEGRVYDPCCGSGGMFVQSAKFIAAHGGNINQISVYGQESNPTTWRLCKMNLAIRGIDANIAYGDTFHENAHPTLRADYIMANPPFNISDWGATLLAEDARWQYGAPSVNNANFAWLQHIVYHLTAQGRAGVVLSNGAMSSSTGTEAPIRQQMLEADLVECMIALPPQLFTNTQIPAALWFFNRAKPPHRRQQVLFIDARKLGAMLDRTQRTLTDDEITTIADTYHRWADEAGVYEDVAGFCKSATLDEIAGHGYVLTPGRYVGAADVEDDGEPFEAKMERLTATLREQFEEGARLEAVIQENLRKLGYDIS